MGEMFDKLTEAGFAKNRDGVIDLLDAYVAAKDEIARLRKELVGMRTFASSHSKSADKHFARAEAAELERDALSARIKELEAWIESTYKEGWQRGYSVGVEDRQGDGPDPWCDADWDGSDARRALREGGN